MPQEPVPEASQPLMPRSTFLQHTLQVLLVGATCLVRPARHARAASPNPPLTEAHLNQFITILRQSVQPDSEALKTQATRDWRALLRAQFTLTPLQKRALEDLPKETVEHVQEAIKDALHANTAFIVRVVAAAGPDPAVERPRGGPPASAPSEGARGAPGTQPDAMRCTRSNEVYACIVQAGVVC
jgi:hypothetical protein